MICQSCFAIHQTSGGHCDECHDRIQDPKGKRDRQRRTLASLLKEGMEITIDYCSNDPEDDSREVTVSIFGVVVAREDL